MQEKMRKSAFKQLLLTAATIMAFCAPASAQDSIPLGKTNWDQTAAATDSTSHTNGIRPVKTQRSILDRSLPDLPTSNIPPEIKRMVTNAGRSSNQLITVENDLVTSMGTSYKNMLRSMRVGKAEDTALSQAIIEKYKKIQKEALQRRSLIEFVQYDADMNGTVNDADFDLTAEKEKDLHGQETRAESFKKQLEMQKSAFFKKDINKDGSISYEEAKTIIENPNEHSGNNVEKNINMFLQMDQDHDGSTSLAEVETAAKNYFKIMDRNSDGKITDDERQILINESTYNFTPRAACKVPEVPAGTQVSLYSSSGGALPTMRLTFRDSDENNLEQILDNPNSLTEATKIVIHNKETPTYLFLTTSKPMIWDIQGAVDKVQHVVLAGMNYDNKSFSGITNIPASKVTYLSSYDCLPVFEGNEAEYMQARSAIKNMTGFEPHIQASAQRSAAIENFDDHYNVNQQPAQDSRALTTPDDTVGILKNAFLSDYPGGIVSINPAKLTSAAKSRNYEILPGAAGLAQLIQSGSIVAVPIQKQMAKANPSLDGWQHNLIEQRGAMTPPDNYRIVKPIKMLPPPLPMSMYGHRIKFSLAPNVPAPEIPLPMYCIISEQTGESIGTASCGGSEGISRNTPSQDKAQRVTMSIPGVFADALPSGIAKEPYLQILKKQIQEGGEGYLDESALNSEREKQKTRLQKQKMRSFDQFDSDKDSVLSHTEIENMIRAEVGFASPLADINTKNHINAEFSNGIKRQLYYYDANKDGKITKEEAKLITKNDLDKSMEPALREYNTYMSLDDGDGKLTFAEIESKASEAFTQVDTDADGIISPKEYMVLIRNNRPSYVNSQCMAPSPSKKAKVVLLDMSKGAYKTDVTVSSGFQTTKASKLAVNTLQPAYVVVYGASPRIVIVDNPARIERIVAMAYPDPTTQNPSIGITGVPAEKISFIDMNKCMRGNGGSTREEAEKVQNDNIERMIGKKPDELAQNLKGANITITDEKTTETVELEDQVISIDPKSVVTPNRVEKLMVPSDITGIRKLVEMGYLVKKNNGTYALVKPLKYLPTDVQNKVEIVIPANMPMPDNAINVNGIHVCVRREGAQSTGDCFNR